MGSVTAALEWSGSEILLALIALAALLIAIAVHRLSSALLSFIRTYDKRQGEITEVMWAKMGCTREEWKKREAEFRLVESEQRHREEQGRFRVDEGKPSIIR